MRRGPDYPIGLDENAAALKGQQLYRNWGRDDRPVPSDPMRRGALREPANLVPTLVFHRRDNCWIPVVFGRYLADHVPAAHYVQIEGVDLAAS